MSWSCERRCRVEEGSGRRSRRCAISELIMSRRILDAPFVDFPFAGPLREGSNIEYSLEFEKLDYLYFYLHTSCNKFISQD